MKTSMQQWQLSAYGLDNLKRVETTIPQPGPGEILVAVQAVSLNYHDKLVVENGMAMPLELPQVPVSDMSGRVVKTGPGATRFQVGERVIAAFRPEWIDGQPFPGDARVPSMRTLGGPLPGVLAEYVCFPESWLVAAPETLSDIEASTLPVAGLTAWFALVEKGGLRAGQSVLVQGTGGVALFGLQIAKAMGAQVIITSSSDEKLQKAQALGADMVINRQREPWAEAVYRLTQDKGVDHILELAGGNDLANALMAVAVGGRISQIGVIDGWQLTWDIGLLLRKAAVIQGISVGHRRSLEDFTRAVDSMRLKPVIDSCYTFSEAPAAFERLSQGPFGKVVITLG